MIPTQSSDPEIIKLLKERQTAYDYQERRHDSWNEIYRLYRNKVITNRLTQRQSVYIPLIKETIKTLMSKIDDPPTVDWKELSGDQMKQLILQEIWNDDYAHFNFEGVDMLDKKNVLTYGRSHKKLLIDGDRVRPMTMDVFDVLVDPLTNPFDIETARFIIHQNIFRKLDDILADKKFSAEGKRELKSYYGSEAGLIQSAANKKSYEEKMERMSAMGVNDTDLLNFVGGDTIVNLTEHLTEVWDEGKKEFVRYVMIYADSRTLLLKEKLKDMIGVDFWPYVSWAEDVETSDYYSDGTGDLLLIPNKIVNIWFSQLVENRTLRNFQMHWYDATNEDFTPQTYEPGAGKMLPAPGNPKNTIMPVEISGLDETMNAIDFITKIVERSSAATAIDKGTSERSQITLGEVEMLVGKSMERTVSMAKYYRRSWEELAYKWLMMTEANAVDGRKLYKISSKGNIYKKKVYPKEWISEEGFKPFVRSSSEQDAEKTESIKRFQFLMSQFPQNSALRRIGQKRMLDITDLTPEEIREIAEEEKERLDAQAELASVAPQVIPGLGQQMQPQPTQQIQQPQV